MRTGPSGRRLVLLGTCPRAVVRCVLCVLSGFAAPGGRCCLAPVRVPWLWQAACLSGVSRGPAWCAAPHLVRSLSVLRSDLPTLWCLSPARGYAPAALLGGCAGHAEAGREPGSLCLPLAPGEVGTLGSLRVVPVRGPAMGLSLAGPSGVGLGLRALRWFACVDPVTDASVFPYRPSFDGGLGLCTGAVSCGRRHLPLLVGGRHARVPCVCACARPSWPGRAGRPPGRVLVRLTFSFGRAVFLLCLAPSGLGLPPSWSLFCPPPLLVAFFFFSPLLFSACLLCPLLSLVSGPGCPGPWRCVLFVLLASLSPPLCCPPGCWLLSGGCRPPPPPPFVSRGFCCRRSVPCVCCCFFCFSPLVCAPVVIGFFFVSGPGCPGPWRCASRFFFLFFLPPASRLAVRSRPFCVSRLAVGCSLVIAAPPPLPFRVSQFSSLPLRALFFSFSSSCVRPRCLWLSLVSGPGCPGPWRRVLFVLWASRCRALRALSPRLCAPPCGWLLPGGCCPPPPPLLWLALFVAAARCSVLFFSCVVCPRGLWLSLVSGPRCPRPRRCALFALLASRFSALRALSPHSCFPPGRWLLPGGCAPPPPPPFVSRGFCRCSSVLCAAWCAVLCAPRCGAAPRCCAFCRPVLCCCVLCCFVACVWCRCLLCRALWRCLSPWGPVLCGAVICSVPPRCVLCAVCVLSWRGGVRCCSPLCFVLCVSWGAVLCVPCPLRSVRCCASLYWCACVVLFVWCVLLLALAAVVRSCVLCCFLWCAMVRCWVWWPVVVCWWCVSVSVSLSGRAVCFRVAGVVCCGALLPCAVFCGAVLSRGAVLFCSAVMLRCCWCLLCPPVACGAVLCCAVGWVCCFLSGGGVCVLWCSSTRAMRFLSSPFCALLCLAVLAVVPCFPVSCAVAPCCRVLLCCRALLSFCGAVCASFALLWHVVRRRAVLCCAVSCRCCFLPSGGVCVLWCPFPPCRQAQKTSIITLCYPASVSVSVVHVVEESGLFVRRCPLVCRRLS